MCVNYSILFSSHVHCESEMKKVFSCVTIYNLLIFRCTRDGTMGRHNRNRVQAAAKKKENVATLMTLH